ncbi:MAG: GlsB/YeaQ/YmgE family stress response membrane protein [Tissierellia bacterium]|nr:GlsB/YeaQ/YmgE family stress response membrane protein [Tissierellia bacterium]
MLSLILWLVFGAIIGWIAGVIMKDQRGILGNIIIGILGSFLGGWISTMTVGTTFNEFSLTGLIFSVIGAVILIFLKQLLMGKRS